MTPARQKMHDPARRIRSTPPSSTEWTPPASVRNRLRPWIDVDELGAAAFWQWLDTMIPVLPAPKHDVEASRRAVEASEVRLRQLAGELAFCASDRARLTIAAAQYFQDNFVLALRVKALEAGLAQLERERGAHTVGSDAEAHSAAERYLSRGR